MDDLDADRLLRALPEWVPDLRWLPETDSTNLQAAGWARQGAAHGSLVVAGFQTAGRGRLDRRWLAPAGSSLLFSVILRPSWPVHRWGLLALAAGVATCRALEELAVPAAVKWPNDVLLDGRKVAGILAESAQGVVILGVGVNVGQRSFPEEISATATSLELHTGRSFGRADLLAGIIRHLAPVVDGPPEAVVDAYRPWCRTLGRPVRVGLESGPVEDVALDIDETGGLLLAGGRVVGAGDVLELR